jgi:hypothetical protein
MRVVSFQCVHHNRRKGSRCAFIPGHSLACVAWNHWEIFLNCIALENCIWLVAPIGLER